MFENILKEVVQIYWYTKKAVVQNSRARTFEGQSLQLLDQTFVLMYRSPSVIPGSGKSQFLEEFEEIVGELLLKSKHALYIFADLNIQLQDPGDSFSVAFNEVLLRFGLKQCINVPTHDKGGILDVFITNKSDMTKTFQYWKIIN